MVQIPAGEFVMGEGNGYPDEGPCARVAVAEPFWMGRFEVTNRQYAAFDPRHDSRLEHGDFIQFSPLERGWPLNLPEQPVVRVPWQRAMEFCRWLSAKTGRTVRPAHGSAMGICLPGGDDDTACLRQPGNRLCALGQFVGRHPPGHRSGRMGRPAESNSPVAAGRCAIQRRGARVGAGRELPGECLGIVRHARKRRGMDAQRLSAISLRRG